MLIAEALARLYAQKELMLGDTVDFTVLFRGNTIGLGLRTVIEGVEYSRRTSFVVWNLDNVDCIDMLINHLILSFNAELPKTKMEGQ
jgi:hypothetical protein